MIRNLEVGGRMGPHFLSCEKKNQIKLEVVVVSKGIIRAEMRY